MTDDIETLLRLENDPEVLRGKLNRETAKMPWRDLQRFFANGSAIFASPELSLVDVAAVIAEDDRRQVEQWMMAGLLAPVSDKQATDWLAADLQMWVVVVKPWVLVQPVAAGQDPKLHSGG